MSTSTPDSPTLTLLHISDLHFGQARGEGRVHFDQLKVTRELVKDVPAWVWRNPRTGSISPRASLGWEITTPSS